MEKSIFTEQAQVLQALLRQVRIEAGLTQVEVAQRLNSQQAIVSNYERGERRLDILELWRVCDAVGIALDEFARRLMVLCAQIEK